MCWFAKDMSKQTYCSVLRYLCISGFKGMISFEAFDNVQNQHITKFHVSQLEFEQEPVESGLSIWQKSSMPTHCFSCENIYFGLILKPRHTGLMAIVLCFLREVNQLSYLANTFPSKQSWTAPFGSQNKALMSGL